jgi:peroxiredoxin
MRSLSEKALVVLCGSILLAATPAHAQFFRVFQNPLIGKQAPDFKLATLKSGEVSMTDFREGKSAIIFFWATWCPHCRTQLKELDKKKEELSRKGIKIILVDLQEPVRQVASYMEKNKLDLEVFLDKDQSVAEQYAIIGVPTFYFLNKDGIIRAIEHEIPSNYEEILASK